MSYNERLEDQIDHFYICENGLTKRKQMGGVGWLTNGNMCVGIYEDLLVVRVEPGLVDSLIKRQGIHIFGHRKGDGDTFLSVITEIYQHPKALHKFLSHALEFTRTLQPKKQSKS